MRTRRRTQQLAAEAACNLIYQVNPHEATVSGSNSRHRLNNAMKDTISLKHWEKAYFALFEVRKTLRSLKIPSLGDYFVAVRGTSVSSVRDWANNVGGWLGLYNGRLNTVLEFVKLGQELARQEGKDFTCVGIRWVEQ
jgi:hypothetical protein